MPVSPVVRCDNHPSTAATTRCLVCGVALCPECAVAVEGHDVCAAHAPSFQMAREGRPPAELPRPDIATRAIAYVTDGVILFGTGAFMLSIVMILLRPYVSFTGAIVAHFALFTAALAIYTTYFISQHGRTPGQELFHLRVVDLHGGEISIGRAFKRWVGYFVSTLTLFYGFLVAAKDRLGQGWPDKLAGTVVVGPSLDTSHKLRAGAILGVILLAEFIYALFTMSVR